jgi:hypothetical protein
MMENPRPFKPEIALIIDENSMNYIVSGREAFRLMAFSAHEVRDRVSRSSSVYGQYLLRDVLKGKVDTKVDIHCASVALSAEERAILKKRAEKNPTIWLIAPGYIDKDQQKQSLEAMTELTGFKFIRPVTRELRARSSGDGMSWGLPYEFGGFSLGAQPFAVVPEKDDILLARFTDNTAAVVYRPGKDGRAPAIFCGTSDLPPLLIRRMAQEAGARVWCEEDLHVQHNGNFASFTAPAAGMYRIDTGHNGKILDIISGETFDGPSVIRHFTPGETLVVKFE